ncbi:DAK2 domain-containing protein [Murimonas intestini]|uniref:DhaL domain-containing protein n=1 Tax=Murimonas intestini TaxID=1337051 RepID=A0AB73TBE7_9FIRM|nr:DAK2 domain-containing protein [Murimonas intestini]MCR1838774.1 DAK2 domain-containing protein [Murimonas intestini]MCR1864074.1 DAK2 domain-containing protein [Murimonas intestini]MCR1881684.1 DAK2 domain-containing protein [Murimonas intestini]
MSVNTINAQLCAKMFLAGAKNLESKKEWINELNVFPVPDGDTGTNMTLTIMSAAKEVAALENPDMEVLSKAISSGSLRGARGNSGVILSQLLRGFTKGIKSYSEIDTIILSNAMQKAVETAYKAVMKPKEGTILTVAKGAADKASELAETDIGLEEFVGEIIAHADYVLSQTPEMLPVLKEAGVVDSGGQGLVEVLKGCYDVLLGKEIDYSIESAPKTGTVTKISPQAEADIKFGYCTEFIIMIEKAYDEETEMDFKGFLESIGDSIVLVSDDGIVKVHVHTNDPGKAISRALTYGSLSRIKIDNMREEHQEKLIKDAEKLAAKQAEEEREKKAIASMMKKEVGFISVSVGEGMSEIFKGLGADYLIEGGQTMNPSTEDMLKAIDQVYADNVFIFPNNKNIIMAANQAKVLTKDKNIIVIPTKTIPQGITAIISYSPEKSVEENEQVMLEEIQNVKTGQITYAVRDTHIDDKEIRQGDIMGIGDHSILAVGNDPEAVTRETVELMMDGDSELISIYYGDQISEEKAQALAEGLEKSYPDCDVEVYSGGQPIYYYVVSVE